MARGSGSSLPLLLVLLALLAGGVGWNYQRNLEREQAERRPFRTLSEADLATLMTATEAEATQLADAHAQARTRRPRNAAASGGGRYGAFERAQQHGRAVRELGYRTSELEAVLEELGREQARRAGEGDGLSVFLRRAFRF